MGINIRKFESIKTCLDFIIAERPLIQNLDYESGPGQAILIFYPLDDKLRSGEYVEHRDVDGTPVTADIALNPGVFPATTDWLDTSGCETLIAYPIITGGVTPTVAIQPVFHDSDVLPNGAHVLHTTSTPLSTGEAFEVTCYGNSVFLRIDAVTGNPTNVAIRVACGSRPNFLESLEG